MKPILNRPIPRPLFSKVLSPNQWGDQLHKCKSFPPNFQMRLPHCLTYSYWDYQQAWFNTFFIQNPKKIPFMVIFLQFEKNHSKPSKLVSTMVELFWSYPTNPNSQCHPLFKSFQRPLYPFCIRKKISPISLLLYKFLFALGMDVEFQISYPRNPTHYSKNFQSKMVIQI